MAVISSNAGKLHLWEDPVCTSLEKKNAKTDHKESEKK